MADIERRRTIAACIDLVGGNSNNHHEVDVFIMRINERIELTC